MNRNRVKVRQLAPPDADADVVFRPRIKYGTCRHDDKEKARDTIRVYKTKSSLRIVCFSIWKAIKNSMKYYTRICPLAG